MTASFAMTPLELRTLGVQPQRSHGVLFQLAEYAGSTGIAGTHFPFVLHRVLLCTERIESTQPEAALMYSYLVGYAVDEPALRGEGELMMSKYNYLDGWLETYIVDLQERR